MEDYIFNQETMDDITNLSNNDSNIIEMANEFKINPEDVIHVMEKTYVKYGNKMFESDVLIDELNTFSINQVLLNLVKKGLLSQTIDENGEIIYHKCENFVEKIKEYGITEDQLNN